MDGKDNSTLENLLNIAENISSVSNLENNTIYNEIHKYFKNGTYSPFEIMKKMGLEDYIAKNLKNPKELAKAFKLFASIIYNYFRKYPIEKDGKIVYRSGIIFNLISKDNWLNLDALKKLLTDLKGYFNWKFTPTLAYNGNHAIIVLIPKYGTKVFLNTFANLSASSGKLLRPFKEEIIHPLGENLHKILLNIYYNIYTPFHKELVNSANDVGFCGYLGTFFWYLAGIYMKYESRTQVKGEEKKSEITKVKTAEYKGIKFAIIEKGDKVTVKPLDAKKIGIELDTLEAIFLKGDETTIRISQRELFGKIRELTKAKLIKWG